MAPQPPKPGRKGPSSAPLDARVREEQERQDRHRTEELLETCEKLEEELEKLKGRFELYFLGVERREPAREREEMKRRVARLKGEFTRNTGLRFRVETLHARFLSYERMWTRSAREKEEGTYRRDLLKARRRADLERPDQQKVEEAPPGGSATPRQGGEQAAEVPPSAATAPAPPPAGTPITRAPAGAAAPGVPEQVPPPAPQAPIPVPAAPRRVPLQLPPGVSEQQLRALHAAYVEAKKRCNEDVSRVSYEVLAKTVAKQVPELMRRYKAKTIEFKVVIKDGRAILKAVPRL